MSNTVSVDFGANATKLMAGLQAMADGTREVAGKIKEQFGGASESVQGDAAKMGAALESLNRTIDAKVELGGDATERLDRLKGKLDEFAHAVATAKAHVDDSDSQRKLLMMEAGLDRLGAKTSRPSITIAGIAESEAKLLAIQAEPATLRDEKISPTVDVDTGGTKAKLDDVGSGAAGAAGHLASLGSSAGSASSGMGALLGVALSLAPALIPIGAVTVGGGLIALPAIAAGAASGLGALKLGFSGIGAALSALQAPVDASGTAMAGLTSAQNSAAQSAASAAQTIVSAQQTLGNAISTQSNDSITATESLASAQQALGNAVQSAANAQVSAAQSVQSATQALAAAVQSAANAQVSAARSVVVAQQGLAGSEQSLQNAQYSEEQAQKSLTQARIDAKDALTNLNDQVKDGVLAQRQAVITVADAQKALASAPAGSNYAQLQLDLAKAVQGQQDLADQQSQLQAKTAQANAQGVEGSNSVQAALHGVQSAQDAVGNAQQAAANAQVALNQAQVTGAQQVAAANQAQANATQALARAQVTATQQVAAANQAVGNAGQKVADAQRANARQAVTDAQAVANAQTAVGTALRNQQFQAQQSAAAIHAAQLAASGMGGAVATAMANLTPAGRVFVNFLKTEVLPGFNELKAQVQGNLLPGIEAGMKAASPAVDAFKQSILASATGIGGLATKFGQFLGSTQGMKDVNALLQLGQQFMAGMGNAGLDVFKALANIGAQAGPIISQMVGFVTNLAQQFLKFSTSAGLAHLLTYITANAPPVFHLLGAIAGAVVGVVKALAPAGSVIVSQLGPAVKNLTPGLVALAHGFGQVVASLAHMLPGLASIVTKVAKFVAGLVKAHPEIAKFAALALLGGLALAKILGPVGKIVEVFKKFATIVKVIKDFEFFAKLAAVATKVWAAAQAAFNLIMDANPLGLLVIAIAAIGVAIYELATHWKQVWKWISQAASDAWHFIDDNFIKPIMGFFSTIVDFVEKHWKLILGIITGPIGLAIVFITSHFDGVVDFFKHIPGRIASIAEHMWDSIKDGFKSVINGIIDLWNSLHFTLPRVDLGPLGSIGGGEIGVPHIPHMAMGGPMLSGMPYVVGDGGGPEIFVPNTSGALIGTAASRQALGGGYGSYGGAGGGDLTLTVPLTVDGRAFAQATARFTAAELNRLSRNQTQTFRTGMAGRRA